MGFNKDLRRAWQSRDVVCTSSKRDATDTTETFGLEPTPFDQQIKATVDSYR